MKKTKMEKGITLIALIITIVVLLILAAVAIAAIQNENILSHANNAAVKYNQAVQNEQDTLGGYLNFLDNLGGSGNGTGGTTQTVETSKNKVLSITINTDVYDEYGNKIVVPAGFKIRVDETTNNADTVTEGIVIEHGTDGNQFVWIPVGKIYTDTAKTEENAKTITLGRYSNFTATDGVYTPDQTVENYGTATIVNSDYTEDTTANHKSDYENAIARNIGDFVTSATRKGGYYIGRYEAGDSRSDEVADRTGEYGTSTDGALVCKANQVPFNYILQKDASSKCQNMYADGYKNDGKGTFSSDLVNSYAWDTAIIFIQTFGTKSNSSTYASTIGLSSIDRNAPQLTGNNNLSKVTNKPIDEQLNIYDMAGNCSEWTTETYCAGTSSHVYRGGNCYRTNFFTSMRAGEAWEFCRYDLSFRPLIYVAL